MAGTFGKKTQADNSHLSNLTGAKWVHIDGSVTTPVTVRATAGRLLRVILNASGSTITLRDGSSEVIGIISASASTGTYNFGIYCDSSIVVVAGGAVDATIVFAE